jgi:hypothetical protein
VPRFRRSRPPDLPSRGFSPEFNNQYARARELQTKHFVDEITDIADDGRNDFMRRATERGEEFVAVVSCARAYALPARLAAIMLPPAAAMARSASMSRFVALRRAIVAVPHRISGRQIS